MSCKQKSRRRKFQFRNTPRQSKLDLSAWTTSVVAADLVTKPIPKPTRSMTMREFMRNMRTSQPQVTA